jgi:hypothetical protein
VLRLHQRGCWSIEGIGRDAMEVNRARSRADPGFVRAAVSSKCSKFGCFIDVGLRVWLWLRQPRFS